MIREYINNVNATQDSWFSTNPYYFVRIDTINHGTDGIQKAFISSFSASNATEVVGTDDAGFNWMGLKNTDVNTSINFTKSFTIPVTGYYLVELFIWKKPTVNGNFGLTIEGTNVWTENGYNKWSDYGTVVRIPIQHLTAGSKSFVLNVPKFAGAGWIKISQLTRYEGGKDLIDTSETRLDLIDASFTQNGVNTLDTLTLKIAMKEDYFTEESGNNPIAFDAGDHVTFVLGQDNREAIPMFGGYIAGWELNDEMTELTLTCVDRLWDLGRTTIKKNFSIGYIPAADSAGTMPYTQFPSINEIARYLCTAMYHIDFNSIIQDYKLYNSFSLATDVSSLDTYGFDTKWETTFGHPGTCMRIIPTFSGFNYITFYDNSNENWNAYDHPVFNFDYYASGAGVKYPVRFNIEIEMWKSGELSSSAQRYVIRFNGPTPQGTYKQLAQVTPKLNGEWQNFTINLKDVFDKVAPSNEYWIKTVKLVGIQENSTVMNRRCSSLYIDQIMGYGYISQAPRYESADSKSALTELQDLCEKCNQVAYTRPGMERSLDQLILLPKRYYTLPITIDNTNVIGVSGMEYKPYEWGIINQASDTFNYDTDRSGTSKAYDSDSEKHYGIIQSHEFLSDVNTMESAQVISKAKVYENSFQYPGFNAVMNGSVLIEPGQYINVNLPEYHINGSYEIQAITHKIDFLQGYFTTELEFNRTTGKFYNMIKRMNNAQKSMEWIRNTDKYATQGSIATGNTSLGAYSV
jgi:hypothetical protein